MRSIHFVATIFGLVALSAHAQNWAGYWCHNREDGNVVYLKAEPVVNGKIKTRVRFGSKEVADELELLEQSGPRYKLRHSSGATAEGEFVSADRMREQQFDVRGQKTKMIEIYRCAEAEAAFTKRAIASAVKADAYRPNDCDLVPDADLSAKYDIESYHARGLAVFAMLSNNTKPLCRVVDRAASDVSRAAAQVMPRLGNRILVSDVANGVFTTDRKERTKVITTWRDSYSVNVTEEEAGKTVVRVSRELMLRDGNGWSQSASDGNNEKWILGEIERVAARLPARANEATSTTATTSAPKQVDVEQELLKLVSMKDKGLISEAEYQQLRRKALGL